MVFTISGRLATKFIRSFIYFNYRSLFKIYYLPMATYTTNKKFKTV